MDSSSHDVISTRAFSSSPPIKSGIIRIRVRLVSSLRRVQQDDMKNVRVEGERREKKAEELTLNPSETLPNFLGFASGRGDLYLLGNSRHLILKKLHFILDCIYIRLYENAVAYMSMSLHQWYSRRQLSSIPFSRQGGTLC